MATNSPARAWEVLPALGAASSDKMLASEGSCGMRPSEVTRVSRCMKTNDFLGWCYLGSQLLKVLWLETPVQGLYNTDGSLPTTPV